MQKWVINHKSHLLNTALAMLVDKTTFGLAIWAIVPFELGHV